MPAEPPTPTLVPGDRAKRPYGRSRRDLAEAAMREFDRRGYAATTVEQIAEAAGYSPRTFFRQFPTKEDVVFFDLPDILSPLRRLLDRPPAAAWPAVCAVLEDNSARWESGGPHLAQVRTTLIHAEPALSVRFLEMSAEWETVITRILAAERGHDPDADVPAQVLAAAIVGACRVALRVWVATPGESLVARLREGLAVLGPL